MVIQCKQCETTYNFDESELSGEHVKVRCVRCKNVFTVSQTSSAIEQPAEPLPAIEPETAPEIMEQTADLQPEPEPTPAWDADGDAFSFSPSEDFSFDDDETLSSQPISEPEAASDNQEPQEFTFERLDSEPEASQPEPVTPPIADEPVAAQVEPKKTPRPTVKKRKTSKLMIVLLLIILMIAGAYGYFFVTLGTTDVMKMIQNIQQQIQQQLLPPAQSQQGELRISTTESYYVDNSVIGQLFVIKGLATNNHAVAQSELCVKGTLYQKKGAPLIHQTVYCGNIISNNELETSSLENLNSQMSNPFGTALSNVNVAPGQSLPFMIVFTDLPDELNEFSVESASSKTSPN